MAEDMPPDRNIGPVLIWVTVALDIIAITLTALRLWIRQRHRILGWDDWTMVTAVVIANTRMIFQILQSAHGNGRHKVYLSDEQYTLSSKWGWYAQLGLFGGNAFVKISICLLILRIKNTRLLKRLMYGVIGGLVLTNITFVIILLAQCSPVNAYWRPERGTCWTPQARIYTAYIAVGYGVCVDILVSLLPAHIVWKLNMATRTKINVSFLMGLALIATAFGIMRAASLGTDTDDLTWDYTIVAIWSNVELWLAIIAANLALARSMYLHFFDRRSSLNASGDAPYYRYGNDNNPPTVGSGRSRTARRGTKRGGGPFDITLNSHAGGNGHGQLAPGNPDDNVVWSECRRASDSRSATASEVPLEPQIQKKTEFYVSSDQHSDSSVAADQVEMAAYVEARSPPRGYYGRH